MKILLTERFVEREPRTPIALLDLAAYGRVCGHDMRVMYVDSVPKQDFGQYDFIGFSSVGLSADEMADLVRLRNRFDGRIVLGGKATTSLQASQCDLLKQLDITVQEGPGENWLGDMELNYANYPPWNSADFLALDRGHSMTEAMSSRGCPYHCHFCHNTESKMRFFSTTRTVRNAAMILNKIARHRVFFVDDVFALRSIRMLDILAEADRSGLELRKRTCFFVHVNHVDGERLEAIVEYNPQEVQMGVESGDDGMLEAMGKKFTADEAQAAVRRLHGRGIRVACLFLIGFPGETVDSLANTVEFVDRNRRYMSGWWVSYYQPVPSTKGWEMVKERTGEEISGGWNTDISYVDPDLTRQDLINAREAIMQ